MAAGIPLLGAFLQPSYFAVSLAILLVSSFILRSALTQNKSNGIPWGLSYMKYVPRWISGLLHCRYALKIIREASRQNPGRAYRLPRHDVDLIVLPVDVVDELARLKDTVASNILALQYDLVGGWCGLGILDDANLHHRVVERRITPNLPRLTSELEDEVHGALADYLPHFNDGWVEVNPYKILNRLAARVFSRIVVGPKYCRDERWLQFAMNFTENVFNSITFMRWFPPWTYPIFGRLLPSVRECTRNIHQAEDLLAPIFKTLLEEQEASQEKKEPVALQENNCLSWLCEIATNNERKPTVLVHSQILLALGAIHTSLFAELNLLFDLMASPANIEYIRSEVSTLAQSGWTHSSYASLHTLDSMLRESQRMSPPFMIGLRRVIRQEHTFANGITVRPGDYVCVSTPAVQNSHLLEDDADPEAFHGLRSYEKRTSEDAMNSTKHQFASVDGSVLGFGYGRTACPGRFSASLTLKIIFAKLMTDYDFEFCDGRTSRPLNLMSNEIISPDPTIKVRVKRRSVAVLPY